MSPPHTPGPWEASYEETTRGLPSWRIDGESVSLLAALVYPTGDVALASEVAANARLISAAPDLADALEALLGDATDSYCEYCDRHAAKNASGQIVSNVPHAEDCPAVAARAALRKAGKIE